MKKLLILPLLLVFQIVSAQWNAIGWNPFTLRSTSGDSTFVLSAPSRVDLQKGTASWVLERQASYKVYTALLTQTGTDAPVATVLENTLGGTVVWTRSSAGVYVGTLTNGFTLNKTILPFTHIVNGAIPYQYDPGNVVSYTVLLTSDDSVTLSFVIDGSLSDDAFTNLPVQIIVYP